MTDEPTPTNGRPYYCADCGLGFGEFLACELPDCHLETAATATARQVKAKRKAEAKKMERKLYIEYRLYVDPTANQETLKEMATQFQEHIYDEWNNTVQPEVLDVKDVTYEIVMEIKEDNLLKGR